MSAPIFCKYCGEPLNDQELHDCIESPLNEGYKPQGGNIERRIKEGTFNFADAVEYARRNSRR